MKTFQIDSETRISKDSEDIPVIIIWGPEGEGHGRVAMVYDECDNGFDHANLARVMSIAPQMWNAIHDALVGLEFAGDPNEVDKAIRLLQTSIDVQ